MLNCVGGRLIRYPVEDLFIPEWGSGGQDGQTSAELCTLTVD
jgi:hypothetical protein